ncbi:hypothetical protein [Paraburkholderia atlantica]|uniref:hypothetical protein n=1 Tax=Paraburkholderia atlantica TaxID=2654982 RepID=UPI000477EBA7|nr:hypothetical protein [Paraburkholderia atlantica]
MEDDKEPKFGPGHPRYLESQALGMSVDAIRKAQGKKSLKDLVPGTPEFMVAEEEFLRDVLRALGEDPDAIDDDDELGLGATG